MVVSHVCSFTNGSKIEILYVTLNREKAIGMIKDEINEYYGGDDVRIDALKYEEIDDKFTKSKEYVWGDYRNEEDDIIFKVTPCVVGELEETEESVIKYHTDYPTKTTSSGDSFSLFACSEDMLDTITIRIQSERKGWHAMVKNIEAFSTEQIYRLFMVFTIYSEFCRIQSQMKIGFPYTYHTQKKWEDIEKHVEFLRGEVGLVLEERGCK